MHAPRCDARLLARPLAGLGACRAHFPQTMYPFKFAAECYLTRALMMTDVHLGLGTSSHALILPRLALGPPGNQWCAAPAAWCWDAAMPIRRGLLCLCARRRLQKIRLLSQGPCFAGLVLTHSLGGAGVYRVCTSACACCGGRAECSFAQPVPVARCAGGRPRPQAAVGR